MAVSAIGSNAVTSVSRRYILPEITDNVYGSTPVIFRLTKANKKMVQGGTQIEVPLMYRRFGAGGAYSGFDKLDMSPSDTIKNGVWDWAQYYVPVAVDGRTLIKVDSPQAIANFLSLQFAQADMEMAANLSTGCWSDGTNPKAILGLEAMVDDGTVAATYAGITRASNTWWNSTVDSSTATLTEAALNLALLGASKGGKHPTLIASRKEQYHRLWVLAKGDRQFNVDVGGQDDILASAGFTNVLFNNIPWVIDQDVPDGPNTSNSGIYMLNEDFLHLVVSPRGDFELEDFQTPIDQDAMASKLLWAGQLITTNCSVHAKLTAVAA